MCDLELDKVAAPVVSSKDGVQCIISLREVNSETSFIWGVTVEYHGDPPKGTAETLDIPTGYTRHRRRDVIWSTHLDFLVASLLVTRGLDSLSPSDVPDFG